MSAVQHETTGSVVAMCGHRGCESKGTYSINAACGNCDWRGTVTLTQGHEFDRWSHRCPRCKCSTLNKAARGPSLHAWSAGQSSVGVGESPDNLNAPARLESPGAGHQEEA